MSETKIIYVGPFGYSGSTLLDMYLGKHENVFSVGEIISYQDWVDNDRLCTCRSKISQCCFWNEIKFHSKLQATKTITRLNDYTPFIFNKRFLKKYGEDQWDLIDRVARESKSEYIVDSSKDLWRLKALALVRPKSIIAIQLYRHPIDVMKSAKKKKLKPAASADTTKSIYTESYPEWKTLIKWVLNNISFKLFNKKNEIKLITTSYEEFTQTPTTITNKIQLKLKEKDVVNISPPNYHNISGSRWRMLKENVTIKPVFLTNIKTKRLSFMLKLSNSVYEKLNK